MSNVPTPPVTPPTPQAPTYATTCPKCGAQLQPVALDPLTAPWLCPISARGYWASELSASARAAYKPADDGWGFGASRVVIESGIVLEISDARGRGTSLRSDQFTVTPLAVLTNLAANAGVNPTFTAEIEVERHNRNEGKV